MTLTLDDWLKTAVEEFVVAETSWLERAFTMAVTISRFRRSQTPYGFEWSVQTPFSNLLMNRSEVTALRICEQHTNGLKYDLKFEVGEWKVIIEIKTVPRSAESWIEADVNKPFPSDYLPYFLAFSYPRTGSAPSPAGAILVGEGQAPAGCRYFLYKKASTTYPNGTVPQA